MEDFLIREIDRLGEMLLMIARKLGLLDGDTPDYSMTDVKDEFGKAGCPLDLDMLLQQENPVWYLVQQEKLSDHGLETMIDIIAWSREREHNLRIDTHRDNHIMQHCIRKAGFQYCGIIYLANGDERLAYQMLAS